MLIDVLCMQLAFIVSYIVRFGISNPYTDSDYRILAIAFLFIDFFLWKSYQILLKNVLKRGYFDELTATCKHVILVELVAAFLPVLQHRWEVSIQDFSYYIMVPFYIAISYAARLTWKKILQKKEFNTEKKSLLILAPERILRETLQTVSQNRLEYSRIVAVSLDTDLTGTEIYGIPIVTDQKDVVEFACGEWIDEVFIPPCDENEYPDQLVDAFMEMGITVHTGITKSGALPSGRQQVEKIGTYIVITTSMNYAGSSKLTVKRNDGHCRRTCRMPDHPADHDHSWSGYLHKLPRSNLLLPEENRPKRKKIQDVQIPKHVHGRRSPKKELMSQNKISDGMMFKLDFDPRIIGNKVLPDGRKKTGIGQFIRKQAWMNFRSSSTS